MTELEVYIRARYPLLYLLTPEEDRAIAELEALGERLGKRVVPWSYTEGLGGATALSDPITALEAIRQSDERAIFVMRDMHPFFGNPAVVRKLREVASALKASAKALVLLSPVLKLPPELAKEATVVDFPLPDAEAIAAMIRGAARAGGKASGLDLLQQERLVAAAKGLTALEISNALGKALVLHRQLDERAIEVMVAEKRQIIRKTGVLEYIDQPEAIAQVGGLDRLKDWLGKRGHAFGSRARDFGLPEPRGLMLVGVQGCGKSLVAKCVAGQWRLPLLRLDVGRLMSGLVGESEENVRRALATAEALAPVVLWVDEIEKGFAGLGGAGDSGTSSRVFATFLTWLQEKDAPVFVVATANDLQKLPAELLRKGRFDEIFFVDLPDDAERRAILEIHLRKRKRHVPDFDLAALAEACEGFSGAEIEQGLIAALYDAFEENRPLTGADVVAAFAATVPLSRTAAPTIERLRGWAAEHARRASGPVAVAAPVSGRIEVDWPVEP